MSFHTFPSGLRGPKTYSAGFLVLPYSCQREIHGEMTQDLKILSANVIINLSPCAFRSWRTVSVATMKKTQQLVALAQRGDQSALGQLCGVYGERLRRMVRLRMGPEIRSQLESMDLVQDALIAALTGLGDFTYRHEGDFLRWLSRIAENRIRDQLDRLHAGKRDIRKEVRLDRTAENSANGHVHTVVPMITTTPSFIVSQREELDRLERAMDRLKPEYRNVIVLAKLEGLGHEEIAQKLGKGSAAVAKLLSRAIVALANAFEEV